MCVCVSVCMYVCMYQIYKNDSNKNISSFYNTLTAKLDENTLAKKKDIAMYFKLESSADKIIFHFHSFNKVTDSVTTQYAITMFYSFYLNAHSQAWDNFWQLKTLQKMIKNAFFSPQKLFSFSVYLSFYLDLLVM